MQDKGVLLRCFSQNIDGLELLAGLNGNKLIQAHGGFSAANCISCNKSHDIEIIKEKIFNEEIPRCDCLNKGLIKPAITFFGESLPEKFHKSLGDFKHCDLLIVMGTSLQVAPFCTLINNVPNNIPRLLINNEPAGENQNTCVP